MKVDQIKDALGRTEGDYLELKNQWASVTIARERGSDSRWGFVVRGEIADMRASSKTFSLISLAMAYALESLGSYRRGSPGQAD